MVAQARQAGVPVEGICLYPVTDYPGWDDERHCPTGLLGYIQADGGRPVYEPLAEEIAAQQRARRTRECATAGKASPGEPCAPLTSSCGGI